MSATLTGILPDPTFYPSPRDAAKAPVETLAYAVTIDPTGTKPDALEVVDVDRNSTSFGTSVGRVEMPYVGDELHHFGWNACSSALCPYAPHPHIERRFLIIPGLRSSRIYVLDTKPDPRSPRIVKVIEPDEVMKKSGYSRLHTVHCGPDGVYLSALGNPAGDAPGGVLVLDHNTFEVKGAWEKDRGPQRLAYDFWWHLNHDAMLTSEWGTPNTIEKGLDLEVLTSKGYGRAIHVWDLRNRKHLQTLPVGENDQMTLELRPAHDPRKTYGFVGVVVSLADLSASVWKWEKSNGSWAIKKVIEVPAEPADPELLPPALKPFKAVPPLISDIDLSLDDRFLYVSCWGTGEMRQYDVTDPDHPKLSGSVHLGGIVRHAAHPKSGPLNGGPQMVEVSRDGKRVYFTNSLYIPWDAQFYPEGIKSWMVKLDVGANGGITPDRNFFVEFDQRSHQVRLQGGDASSDSYCFS
ncbi:MAG TPA: selenium-binding protein SBP56-related protein [Gemmatimonadaceae bacterium]|nr:selenium-binding protein SBP56-related protein [Gemmatimonadaceae bacterium]